MAKTETKTDKTYKVYLLYEDGDSGGGVRAGDENEAWPNYENVHHHFKPTGLKRKAPSWSETIEIDFDPKGLEHLYVVVVRYSSGCTFGNSYGHWEIIGAYKTYNKAEKMEMSIPDNGYSGSKPWKGYFEAFEGVSVERVSFV